MIKLTEVAMKQRITFVLFFSFFFFVAQEAIFSQDHTLKVLAFPGLSSLDFAGFVVTDNLQGTPNVFQIIINPPVGKVRLHGVLVWRDVGQNASTAQLVEFFTKAFPAKTILNSDLGNTVQLQSHQEATDIIKKILDKGRPSGTFTLRLDLMGETDDRVQSSDVATLTFDNPTQTLSLIYPTQGLSVDPGNVLAVWSTVQGVKGDNDTYYFIRASERRNPNQSLEDALNSGTAFINNQKIFGNVTAVNLRSLQLDREWLPGQEVVLQIGAHISGVGGGSNIFSQPISFSISRQNSAGNQALITSITNLLQGFTSLLPPKIVAGLFSGQLNVNGVTGDNRVHLTPAEIEQIMNFLQAHSQNIISITFHSK
jgi:hypothetical protein